MRIFYTFLECFFWISNFASNFSFSIRLNVYYAQMWVFRLTKIECRIKFIFDESFFYVNEFHGNSINHENGCRKTLCKMTATDFFSFWWYFFPSMHSGTPTYASNAWKMWKRVRFISSLIEHCLVQFIDAYALFTSTLKCKKLIFFAKNREQILFRNNCQYRATIYSTQIWENLIQKFERIWFCLI